MSSNKFGWDLPPGITDGKAGLAILTNAERGAAQ